jgi:hypothetical protein
MSSAIKDLKKILKEARRRKFPNRTEIAKRMYAGNVVLDRPYTNSEDGVDRIAAGFENEHDSGFLETTLFEDGQKAHYFRLYIRNLDLTPKELSDVEERVKGINLTFSWNLDARLCPHKPGLRRHLGYLDRKIAEVELELESTKDRNAQRAAYIDARNSFLLAFPYLGE